MTRPGRGFLTRLRPVWRFLRSERGITLLELLLVVALVGTLALIGMPALLEMLNRSKVEKAKNDITSLQFDVRIYFDDNEFLPISLNEVRPVVPLDPWGNEYQYLNLATAKKGDMRKDQFLVPINSDYDLYSMGPDGQSSPPLTAKTSQDDIVRAGDGNFVGLAKEY